MTDFFQDPPRIENAYEQNRWLRIYLRSSLPGDLFKDVDQDLKRFGRLCASEYLQIARRAEREKPVHVPYDPWGERLDEIRLSTAWKDLQDISAREGLVHMAFERKHGELSRLVQFAKLFLFHPASAFFTCPLAMADGAARLIELHGETDFHKEVYAHLTSNDPKEFWTSGQWMTEKTGGSDVSRAETEARTENGATKLYGTKWFSSATTSAVAMALARTEGAPEGSRGLTLFLVPVFKANGRLNGVRVLRLKDKLGTTALPTAELSLEGAAAYRIGGLHQGVKSVASMLNITRLYNSICSVATSAHGLDLLRDYSSRREVFGKSLSNQVMHIQTFVKEEAKTLAGFLLTMNLVHLMGREECRTATVEDTAILRLFTPICKLFTARAAIQTASEVIEGFGGAGYIEDTGIPIHLRDAQVFPIWEGATSVLSLDLLRVYQKTWPVSASAVKKKLTGLKSPELKAYGAEERWTLLNAKIESLMKAPSEIQEASARPLAFHMAWEYSFILALEWMDRLAPPERRSLLGWLDLWQRSEWEPATSKDLETDRSAWVSNPQ